MLRLSEARRALSSPVSTYATVTQIATDHGFVELGRFSVEYRRAFGEPPSATLRRAQQLCALQSVCITSDSSMTASDQLRKSEPIGCVQAVNAF
jgi:AraC-like DNA-binding protein